MLKASFTLPNGTSVQIEGPPEEVKELLNFYSAPQRNAGPSKSEKKGADRPIKTKKPVKTDADSAHDLASIINKIKTCSEAENIELGILDRTGVVDRILLPLYIVHEHFNNAFGLSSGEISKITNDLSVPVAMANASRRLSGVAAKYVVGDRMRKRGYGVRYKISRRGVQYLKAVIAGASSEK